MVRPVHITLISVRDLDDVDPFSEIKPYAFVEIHDSQSYDMKVCPEDAENGTNPNWNYLITFMAEEAALWQDKLQLVVRIRARGSFGDKEVGGVSVPILRSLSQGEEDYQTYELYKPSGGRKGILNMSVKIGETTDTWETMQSAAPAQGEFFPYLPGPFSVYSPLPYGTFYTPLPPGSSYSPLPPHGVPYPPQVQGYPPQGHPSQGYPTQNQDCLLLQQCLLKLVMEIMIQCMVGYAGGFIN